MFCGRILSIQSSLALCTLLILTVWFVINMVWLHYALSYNGVQFENSDPKLLISIGSNVIDAVHNHLKDGNFKTLKCESISDCNKHFYNYQCMNIENEISRENVVRHLSVDGVDEQLLENEIHVGGKYCLPYAHKKEIHDRNLYADRHEYILDFNETKKKFETRIICKYPHLYNMNPNTGLCDVRKFCLNENVRDEIITSEGRQFLPMEKISCTCKENERFVPFLQNGPECINVEFEDLVLLDDFVNKTYVKEKRIAFYNPCKFDARTNKPFYKKFDADKFGIELVEIDGISVARCYSKIPNEIAELKYPSDYLKNNNGIYSNALMSIVEKPLKGQKHDNIEKLVESGTNVEGVIMQYYGQRYAFDDLPKSISQVMKEQFSNLIDMRFDQTPMNKKYVNIFSSSSLSTERLFSNVKNNNFEVKSYGYCYVQSISNSRKFWKIPMLIKVSSALIKQDSKFVSIASLNQLYELCKSVENDIDNKVLIDNWTKLPNELRGEFDDEVGKENKYMKIADISIKDWDISYKPLVITKEDKINLNNTSSPLYTGQYLWTASPDKQTISIVIPFNRNMTKRYKSNGQLTETHDSGYTVAIKLKNNSTFTFLKSRASLPNFFRSKTFAKQDIMDDSLLDEFYYLENENPKLLMDNSDIIEDDVLVQEKKGVLLYHER